MRAPPKYIFFIGILYRYVREEETANKRFRHPVVQVIWNLVEVAKHVGRFISGILNVPFSRSLIATFAVMHLPAMSMDTMWEKKSPASYFYKEMLFFEYANVWRYFLFCLLSYMPINVYMYVWHTNIFNCHETTIAMAKESFHVNRFTKNNLLFSRPIT